MLLNARHHLLFHSSAFGLRAIPHRSKRSQNSMNSLDFSLWTHCLAPISPSCLQRFCKKLFPFVLKLCSCLRARTLIFPVMCARISALLQTCRAEGRLYRLGSGERIISVVSDGYLLARPDRWANKIKSNMMEC